MSEKPTNSEKYLTRAERWAQGKKLRKQVPRSRAVHSNARLFQNRQCRLVNLPEAVSIQHIEAAAGETCFIGKKIPHPSFSPIRCKR